MIAHEAVAATVTDVLDEIRWRHPTTRVSCIGWIGPFLTVLASSAPSTMEQLELGRVDAGMDRPWAHLLGDGLDTVLVADVRQDPRFDGLPAAILGKDTIAMRLLGLRVEGRLIGFLRMDATDASHLGPQAALSLDRAMPYALVAVALERERAFARSCALALPR